MRKREFLRALLLPAAAAPVAAWAEADAKRSSRSSAMSPPTLLTITGDIGRTNRGPFDKSLDVLMSKHELSFDKAFNVDFPMLASLPAATIEVTIGYDGKKHRLSGPSVSDVLKLADARISDATKLSLRAVDGYAPKITLSEARRLGFIIATHRDGKPLALGGLGPLWAIYPADRFPDVMSRALTDRFAACPWGLYHVDVVNA